MCCSFKDLSSASYSMSFPAGPHPGASMISGTQERGRACQDLSEKWGNVLGVKTVSDVAAVLFFSEGWAQEMLSR